MINTVNITHQNRLKDGRGQGRGQDYIPFIQANDNKVASEGWLTRTQGWHSNRIHHTLSKYEYQYLLVQEWTDQVTDIREQFPLPIEETQRIARKLNIMHAHLKGDDVVQTSDFMLSIKDNKKGIIDTARTFKPTNKLTKRTLELFEIERRYYKEIGIEWKVVFDIGRPINFIKNIDWLHDAWRPDVRPGMDSEMVNIIAEPIFEKLKKNGTSLTISKSCLKCDQFIGLEAGTSMFMVKHMLANKRWVTDMNALIRESAPLALEKPVK
ncbi:TnsA endonuclease C-terminal domain-containing protein [Paenibacillus sp. FSL M7-0420]|uniref:TnsA endonuclease C-terminal domain-containing protein n=1 Tax=Paenibacillus sp. FSL M7-0420 TaxID=2921609 RepID=UPI0030F96777